MSIDKTVSFCANLNSLHPMLEWIRNHLEEAGFSDVEVRRIEVALEEALVNIISYAYQGEEGMIELSCHLEEKYVELVIKDEGLPFNPLKQVKKVDPLIPIEEREVGGLGILFILEIMDTVDYTRSRETNILTLRKNF